MRACAPAVIPRNTHLSEGDAHDRMMDRRKLRMVGRLFDLRRRPGKDREIHGITAAFPLLFQGSGRSSLSFSC